MVNQTVEVFGGLDILVTKHGRLISVSITVSPLKGPGGGIVGA